MKKFTRFFCLVLIALAASSVSIARADVVTDWNKILFEAALVPPATSPLVITRNAAIVHAAVFDAVNGVERRYTPFRVDPAAPRKTSSRAAAVQAAYATLVRLYPAQKSTLDAKLAASLAAIASGTEAEKNGWIARGIEWGQTVADAIWALRSNDGFAPPPPAFLGGSAVGEWRPTPPGLASGAGPQFAYMTPWVMQSPLQFRPAGPPAINSERYLADFDETKTRGGAASLSRTADQTIACLFWNSTSASYFWNNVAASLAAERKLTLSQNARLFALVNLAVADAAIACWEAKYHYVFWRPITAIPLAETDGNAATMPDACWAPLFATPNHPEYPSGHSSFSSAAAAVLADHFGEETAFSVKSDVMLGVVRSFPSFSKALEEIKEARIFAGIHFRAACDDGHATGRAVANYVIGNVLRPVN